MVTTTAIRRLGAYSDISATTLDIAPPSARPVRNRKRTTSLKDVARRVRTANGPNTTVQITIGHFRPQRSAIGPTNSEEIIKPSNAAVTMGPKVFTGT